METFYIIDNPLFTKENQITIMLYAIIFISAFLIGSFPTGWLAHRALRGTDIRAYGSGSTGATNTFRQLGWKWGMPVMLIDFLKGFLPVIAVLHYFPEAWILLDRELLASSTGMCSVLGHIFPPWLAFRGGKGIATGAGFLTALFPPIFPVGIILFALVTILSRKISLASLSTAVGTSICYFVFTVIDSENATLPRTVIFSVIPILVGITHRKNIQRLISGKERPIV